MYMTKSKDKTEVEQYKARIKSLQQELEVAADEWISITVMWTECVPGTHTTGEQSVLRGEEVEPSWSPDCSHTRS